MSRFTHAAELLKSGATKSHIIVLGVLEEAPKPLTIEEIAELADLNEHTAQKILLTLLRSRQVSYQTNSYKREYILQRPSSEYEATVKKNRHLGIGQNT